MRRTVKGYLDMGRIRIPALPQGMVLTDRDDGTLWLLTHNTTEPTDDDLGHVSITSGFTTKQDYRTYMADEGPILGGNPSIRLLVRGGYLGYEMVDQGRGVRDFDQAPIYTRHGNRGLFSEIIVPTTWQHFDNVLGWVSVEP